MTAAPDRRWAGGFGRALTFLAQIAAIFAVSFIVLIERGGTMFAPFFFLPLSCFSGVLAGPMVITAYRKNRKQPVNALLSGVVLRATGAVWLIVIFSVVQVNLFFGNGALRLMSQELFWWALALSVTAAASAAAMLALLASRVSLDAAKWGFRVLILGLVLLYRFLPVSWAGFWYDLVEDRGVSPVAFGWWLFFASTTSGAFFLLKRRERNLGVS